MNTFEIKASPTLRKALKIKSVKLDVLECGTCGLDAKGNLYKIVDGKAVRLR